MAPVWYSWSALKEAWGVGESSLRLAPETLPSFNVSQISEHVFEVGEKPDNPRVEIVCVHGLQLEDPKEAKPHISTWLSRNKGELWLNWIRTEIPSARILTVTYDASTLKTDTHGRLDMYATCENLLQELNGRASVGEARRPIVLVGHCLGGLVLKSLCLFARNQSRDKHGDRSKRFLENVKGIMCYASPHHGTELLHPPESRTGLLFKDLDRRNTETARRREEFRKLRETAGFRSCGVAESLPSKLKNFEGLIVPEGSSRDDVDTDRYYTDTTADHFSVSRPESEKSTSFTMLLDLVREIIEEDGASLSIQTGLPHYIVDGIVKKSLNELHHNIRVQNFSRIALVGMGGIGKTTLARALYESLLGEFHYACFYKDVKISMRVNEDPDDLRKKLSDKIVDPTGRSATFQWNKLKGKRVLLILDDPKSEAQVKVMTKEDGFSPGSCLVVTARDRGFLESANSGFHFHKVNTLPFKDSKKLFCSLAFEKDRAEDVPLAIEEKDPPEDVFKDVEAIINKCGGLPLALVVTARFLRSKKGPVWKEACLKLQKAEPFNGENEDGLFSILKISIDDLAKPEKEMFLDAAACFYREELEYVKMAWKSCYAAESGWQNLLDKHLVKEEEVLPWEGKRYARIEMHEVLRDLGCNIAGSSRMSVRDLRRIDNFSKEERRNVKVVTGRMVDSDWRHICKLTGLKFLWLQGEEEEPNGDDVTGDSHLSAPAEILFVLVNRPSILTLRMISQMKSLHTLQLEEAESSLNSSSRPRALFDNLKELRVLGISSSNLTEIPEFGPLESLKDLDLCLDLMTIPKSICDLRNLHCLVVRDCRNLLTIPGEIGRLGSLERLVIGQYAREYVPLVMIPAEIGLLQNLKFLTISGCELLRSIPTEIGLLGTLESLKISNCRELVTIPTEIGRLSSLQILKISCDNLITVPTEIGRLSSLQILNISCNNLITVPTEIGQLGSLRVLKTRGWNLKTLPGEIGELRNLQKWKVLSKKLVAIPTAIRKLQNLESLDISCTKLVAIPAEIGQLQSLKSLNIHMCYKLVAIPAEIGQLQSLQSLTIHGSDELVAITAEIGRLQSLASLRILFCHKLEAMPAGIGQLRYLQLEIRDCANLKEIPAEIRRLQGFQLFEDPARATASRLLSPSPSFRLSLSLSKFLMQRLTKVLGAEDLLEQAPAALVELVKQDRKRLPTLVAALFPDVEKKHYMEEWYDYAEEVCAEEAEAFAEEENEYESEDESEDDVIGGFVIRSISGVIDDCPRKARFTYGSTGMGDDYVNEVPELQSESDDDKHEGTDVGNKFQEDKSSEDEVDYSEDLDSEENKALRVQWLCVQRLLFNGGPETSCEDPALINGCICGDAAAWKVKGFCSEHEGPGLVLDAILQVWVSKLNAAVTEICIKKLKTASITSLAIIKMLLWSFKASKSMLKCTARYMEDVKIMDALWGAQTILPRIVRERLHNLWYKLSKEPNFKRSLAQKFIERYPQYLLDSIQRGGVFPSKSQIILKFFSNWLFTSPILTRELVVDSKLLDMLLKTLEELLVHAVGDCGVAARLASRVVKDINYVMSDLEVAQDVAEQRPDLYKKWPLLVALVQDWNCSDVTFERHDALGATSMAMIDASSHVINASCAGGKGAQKLKVLNFERNKEPKGSSIVLLTQVFIGECINILGNYWLSNNDMDIAVSGANVSFRIPLHRALALLLHNALVSHSSNRDHLSSVSDSGDDFVSLQQLFPEEYRSHFVSLLMEHPLRLQVYCSQEHGRRDYYKARSFKYRRLPWCEDGSELDLFLLQCCSTLVPAEEFVERVQTRFGLKDYFTLQLKGPTEYEPYLAQEFLVLLIRVCAERRFCGLSPPEALRRELVQRLAAGRTTRTSLLNSLPRRLRNSDYLEECLKLTAANQILPGMQQGPLTLQKECWEELDLYHPYWGPNWRRHWNPPWTAKLFEYSERPGEPLISLGQHCQRRLGLRLRWSPRRLRAAAEHYFGARKSYPVYKQLPSWTMPFPALKMMGRFIVSKRVHDILLSVFFHATFSESWEVTKAEDLFLVALHVLGLALDVCRSFSSKRGGEEGDGNLATSRQKATSLQLRNKTGSSCSRSRSPSVGESEGFEEPSLLILSTQRRLLYAADGTVLPEQHSLISLLVLLLRRRASAVTPLESSGEPDHYDERDVLRTLLRRFAELHQRCRDEIESLAPELFHNDNSSTCKVGSDGIHESRKRKFRED